MYTYLTDIASALQKSLPVQSYNIDPSCQVYEVKMLPMHFDPAKDKLKENVLYVCEYRQLIFLDPMLDIPPLVCVVERAANADSVLLQRHQVIAAYDTTVVEVLVALTNCIYETGARSSHVTEQTMRLIGCKSRTEMILCAYDLMRIPIIMTDVSQKIVAHTPVELVSSPVYREIVASGYLPVGDPAAEGASCEVNAEDTQVLSQGRAEIGIPPSLVITMTLNGQKMGHLHAMAFTRPFTYEDRQLLQFLGNALAISLANRPISRRQDPNYASVFLRDILDNLAGTPDEIMTRQRELKLPLKQFLYAAIIKPRAVDFAAHIDYIDLCRAFQQLLPGCYSCLFRDSIVVLLNSKTEILDMEEYLEPVRFLLEKHKLIIGISNPFTAVHQLRRFAFQARKAIHFGTVLDPDRIIYPFTDYLLPYMSELALQTNDLDTMCPPELIRLIIYCRENGDDLMDTLKVYLKCGRSKKDTAQSLFVHINTIKYRIAQIQNICHMDLADDMTALRLILAFKMMEYRDHFKGYTPMFEESN